MDRETNRVSAYTEDLKFYWHYVKIPEVILDKKCNCPLEFLIEKKKFIVLVIKMF